MGSQVIEALIWSSRDALLDALQKGGNPNDVEGGSSALANTFYSSMWGGLICSVAMLWQWQWPNAEQWAMMFGLSAIGTMAGTAVRAGTAIAPVHGRAGRAGMVIATPGLAARADRSSGVR